MSKKDAENNMKSLAFFGRRFSVWSFFEQVWENSSKNPSHLQKFACSYTCDPIEDFLAAVLNQPSATAVLCKDAISKYRHGDVTREGTSEFGGQVAA